MVAHGMNLSGERMKASNRKERTTQALRTVPETGTQTIPQKHQGYQLPLHLWQDLVDEAVRRRKLGLPLASQNAIAIAAIAEWLEQNKETL